MYMVWGIIVFISAGLTLLVAGINIIALSGFLSYANKSTVLSDMKNSMSLYLLMIIFGFALVIAIKIFSGISLVRSTVKGRGLMIFLTVMYFIAAFVWLILIVILIAANSYINNMFDGLLANGSSDMQGMMAFYIVVCFVKLAEDVATGIFLLSKRSKAIIDDTPPISSIKVGSIRGMFGSFINQVYELYENQTCTVGRGGECDISIIHAKVSRIHCTIRKKRNSENYLVKDFSSNGTFCDNTRLEKGVEYEIYPGAFLVIGDADNVLLLE